MAEDLSKLIGWGLIGTSDGMQAKCGGCISGFDIRNIVDLDNRFIEVHAGTEVLCVYTEIRNNLLVSYYCLYRFAREMNSGRPGTFYGSVLVSVKYHIDAKIIYQILNELASSLTAYLDKDKRFTANLSSIPLAEPGKLKALAGHLSLANPKLLPGSDRAFQAIRKADESCAAEFFKLASQPQLIRRFNRVYGSASKEIISFVQKRKALKVIDPRTISHELRMEGLELEIGQLQLTLEEHKKQAAQRETALQNQVTQLRQELAERDVKILTLQRANEKELNELAESAYSRSEHQDSSPVANRYKEWVSLPYHSSGSGDFFHGSGELHSGEHNSDGSQNSEPPTIAGDNFFGWLGYLPSLWKIYKAHLLASLVCLALVLYFLLHEKPGLLQAGSGSIANSITTSDPGASAAQKRTKVSSTPLSPLASENKSVAAKSTSPVNQPSTKGAVEVPGSNGVETLSRAEIRNEVLDYVKLASAQNNFYDPARVKELMSKLNSQGMQKDSVAKSLSALEHNYCFSAKSSSELKEMTYAVRAGDNSLSIILRHIEAAQPRAKNFPGFEPSFKARNHISAKPRFVIGQKLVFFLPV